MDWGNVTAEDLVNALKEVEWSTPPRPLAEFFSKFTVPKTRAKWTSRLKCNLYYYRTNYFILVTLVLVIGFIRNPLALIAVSLAGLSVACLNDSFAVAFSERLVRLARRISPPLAAKLRAPITPGARGRPLKGTIYICGRDRRFVVSSIFAISALLWFLLSSYVIVFGALAAGIIFSWIHASFRTPNLKARLNSFREEFRAVWRGYSDA
ncbi:hypothetical protein O6H91_13G002600 [Diphasiastrum complanatum]|uniref:Uncharacterized protein n=1 Tax=Diphasiastrum complanatum TaxID=34168 RepID=A0ACC2BRV2_DIPCM|nr:hypothetical protein O6H91_Y347500 [Diphasiastrum complanatum]KAJ7532417.1 hypothetical protein O6H91_13G002600 [Diphasiastrum complanatum]